MSPAPWYREPWPWLVMAGPAAVVVAGVITTVIAFRSFDGVVADDYYKQGLGINRVIAREAAARSLGVSAAVAFAPRRERVRVTLAGDARPASLRLKIVHPTQRNEDRMVLLAMGAPGVYEGVMRAPRDGTFRVQLEDGEGRWRLAGDWNSRDDATRLPH
jgi:uncharacterized protein